MKQFIVLDRSNLKETERRTGIAFESIKHMFQSAKCRKNQFVIFNFGTKRPRWTGIEIPDGVSIEWLIRYITKKG
jgi:hypothetical protein